MLFSRSSLLPKSLLHHLRHHSSAVAVATTTSDLEPQDILNPVFTYLKGFPTPDPKHAETIRALPRADSGSRFSVKLREQGRVPSIVFEAEDGEHGGNKRLISVENNQIKKLVKHLGRDFFLSRLFELEVRPDLESEEVLEKVRVLPRLLHQNAGTDAILNVTFIRAPPSALLKIDVPLVFRGEDVSPGLKKGSHLNIIKRTVKYLCPADIIPPYIDVDLSEMDVGDKLVMGDMKVHPALKLLKPANLDVVKIPGKRVYQKKAKNKDI